MSCMKTVAMEKKERNGVLYRIITETDEREWRFGQYTIQDNDQSDGGWGADIENIGFKSLAEAKERLAYLLSK